MLRLVGRRQWRLWPAIWITVSCAVRDPYRIAIGSLCSLGFAAATAIQYKDYVMNILIALFFGAAITFASTIPWRLRIGPRRPAGVARLLIVNGTLSVVAGLLSFFLSLTTASLIVKGWTHTLHIMRYFIEPTAWGLLFPIAGMPLAIAEEFDRIGVRSENKRRRMEQLAEAARLAALRAQINPHFFFNALNSIAALIPTDPASAERAVELLATALRPVLTRNQPMLNTLESEMDVARAYGEIERLRLGDRLDLRFDAAPGIGSVLMPSLCLQPLLENAIVHGAARSREPVRIEVRAHASGEHGTLIEIRNAPADRFDSLDSMNLQPVVSPSGHAVHNIDSRLKALFGGEAGLRVRADAGLSHKSPSPAHNSQPTTHNSQPITPPQSEWNKRADGGACAIAEILIPPGGPNEFARRLLKEQGHDA